MSLQSSEPKRHLWTVPFCCSLFAHLGIVLVIGFYFHASRPRLENSTSISVELITEPKRQEAPDLTPSLEEAPPAAPPQVPLIEPPAMTRSPETLTIESAESVPVEISEPAFESPDRGSFDPLPEATPSPSKVDESQKQAEAAFADLLMLNYAAEIRGRINKVKRYPLMARKFGKQGTVEVKFSVDQNGKLLDKQIVSSSGFNSLDKAALRSLGQASPFSPLPDALVGPQTFNVHINFFLAE